MKKVFSISLLIAFVTASGCGKENTTATGTVLSASTSTTPSLTSFDYWRLFGISNAWATVSSYTTLKLCVSEVVYETLSGSSGSPTTPLRPGLLTFNPASVVSVGTIQIPSGTQLKNIKFSIATVPSLCQGADYSVLFNPASSESKITQDKSFKFEFGSAGHTVTGTETVNLYLENIINQMAALGTITNENFQTVNAGQAK